MPRRFFKSPEFSILDRVLSGPVCSENDNILKGPGDDAAVLKTGAGHPLLLSSDTSAEGTHFSMSYFSYYEAGYKSVVASVSDISAMGGTPFAILADTGVPSRASQKDISELFKGIKTAAADCGASLSGGDFFRTGRIIVSVTAAGYAGSAGPKYRNGASEGDRIFITGECGKSSLGLSACASRKSFRGINSLRRAHKIPEISIEAGKILGDSSEVTSMIDTSDGLSSEISHISHSSGCGALLEYEKIPVPRSIDLFCRELGLEREKTVLQGGEDFNLLFTIRGSGKTVLEKMSIAGIKYSEIGIMTGKNLYLRKESINHPLKPGGYTH
ncbi:MAG: thiamine-phosphate kinase [Fibrobacterota bacterium]